MFESKTHFKRIVTVPCQNRPNGGERGGRGRDRDRGLGRGLGRGRGRGRGLTSSAFFGWPVTLRASP